MTLEDIMKTIKEDSKRQKKQGFPLMIDQEKI